MRGSAARTYGACVASAGRHEAANEIRHLTVKRKNPMGWLASSLLLTLSVTQATGAESAGPYYATPSWNQQLPAATRFIVLTNWASAAVLDRETGLV